jgi:hypothetical protein
MKYQSVKQRAKIYLNSRDAVKDEIPKTLNTVPNVNITTNYRFNMNIPLELNEKSRLAVSSFRYKANVGVLAANPTVDIGKVYIKNIPPRNIFSSEGFRNGTPLLNMYFSNSNANNAMTYNDLEMNDIELPSNTSWLNNGIDICVDTMKKDDNGTLINGCPSDDDWTMVLIIYDIEDYEYLEKQVDNKVHNIPNATRLDAREHPFMKL